MTVADPAASPEASRGDADPPVPMSHRNEADLARVQVELAAQAAVATPLSELDAAHDVSRIQPVLQQLLRAVADLLGTDMAAVWVTGTSADELYPVAWTGLPDGYLTGLRIPVGSGSAGRAVAERAPVLVSDVAADTGDDPYGDDRAGRVIRSALSVPMLTLTGEPMGALTAYRRQPDPVGERETRLAEMLARQAAEMVERARMHGEARKLAALERRRAAQLRGLADAAMALTSAETLDDLLRVTTEAAVSVVGCHQGVATRLPHGWADATTYVSLSEKYAAWRDFDLVPKGRGVLEYVVRENRPLRLTGEELVRHPDWRGLRDAPDHPPLPDYLAAPFIGRDGRNLGLLQLSHKTDETPFSAEDEAIVVQLAQMVSSAIERIEALERERTARRDAEEAARVRGLLSDASAAFAGSLEPAEVAERLVDAAVPWLASQAVLHVPDDQGLASLLAATAQDSDRAENLRTVLAASTALDPASPYGPLAVLRTGRPQLLAEVTDQVVEGMARSPGARAAVRALAPGSALVVPLIARGGTVGVLSLGRDEPYDDADLGFAVDLAQRAALALDNANRYAFERTLAGTLQRSLLPRELPTSALLGSAARYLPGARGTQIGGDWYDLLEVGEGLVLVVGDVMGRGVHAASVMGQLRSSVRALALAGHRPADVLRLLERVAAQMDDLHFATCLVAQLDPHRRMLRLASAGHLPPLVLAADGTAEFLDVEPGLPLGVGVADVVEHRVQLGACSAVLLYTDGLVEQRGRAIDDGMARLRTGVQGQVSSAEELCDRALRVMGRDGGHDDDTAVLALLLDAGEEASTLELDLPAAAASAAVAREALLELLANTGHCDLTDTAALLVTELVANTARHAPGQVRVRARVRTGLLLVEVADQSTTLPQRRTHCSWQAESGRGLLLVDQLADRWGAERLPTGKRVWFELGRRTSG